MKEALERDGFCVLKNAIAEAEIEILITELSGLSADRDPTQPGIRCLLRDSSVVSDFADNFGQVIESFVKDSPMPPRAVRAILFDKTPASNWYVTWHQDRTIPIQNHEPGDLPDFKAWSLKNGVHHVQPPASILEHVLAARITLDNAPQNTGGIKFIPGTHRKGILADADIAAYRTDDIDPVEPATTRGDAILMRPLLLHASSKATTPLHRRVLHIEYACTALPPPLEWGRA